MGPAFYRPNVEAVKTKHSSQVNFHRSGTERKLWEATNVMGNSQPDATLPGPGYYDHKSSLRVEQAGTERRRSAALDCQIGRASCRERV